MFCLVVTAGGKRRPTGYFGCILLSDVPICHSQGTFAARSIMNREGAQCY